MQLGILLAVLATILFSENAPPEPVGSALPRVVATVAAGFSITLLAACGSLSISRRIRTGGGDPQSWLRWFGRLQQWHLTAWLATLAVIVFGLHWPQVVRYNWGLDRVLVLRDLLLFAPIWLPLLLSWGAFYEVERAVQGRHCGTRSAQHVWGGRRQFVWLRARHYLGLCLLPIVILLAFQDLVAWWMPTWSAGEFGWLLYLVPLVGVTLAFPQLLSRIWKTTRLPQGELRNQLEALTRRAGVRTRDFRVWQTNRQMLNAAVTGLLPSLRYVFLTDGLLALLRAEETQAVVAHELGHVRRRHLWLRLLLLALPIWILGNVQAFLPEISDLCSRWISQGCGDPLIANAVVIPALTIGYSVIALGKYSRLLEHDADLQVYATGDAEIFCMTLDRLSFLTHDRRQRGSWLHPSTASRVHLLRQALRDRSAADRFRRRVDYVNGALIVAWLLPPIVLILACQT